MVQNHVNPKLERSEGGGQGPAPPARSSGSGWFAGQVAPKTRQGATGLKCDGLTKRHRREGKEWLRGRESLSMAPTRGRGRGVWLTEFLSPRSQKMWAVPRAGGPDAPDSSEVKDYGPAARRREHSGEAGGAHQGSRSDQLQLRPPQPATVLLTHAPLPWTCGSLTLTVQACFWGL